MKENREQTAYIVGDEDAGLTSAERLRRVAIQKQNPLNFKALSLSEARKKFVDDDDEAAGIFLHLGGDNSRENPLELAKALEAKGYKVLGYIGGGRAARKQLDKEFSGKERTISRWDFESIKEILEMGMEH